MKSIKRILTILIIATFFYSCETRSNYNKLKTELEKLKVENITLNKELDEFKFGEDRIIALFEKAKKSNDYSEALRCINLLSEKHPESSKISELKKHEKTLKNKLNKEIKRKYHEIIPKTPASHCNE